MVYTISIIYSNLCLIARTLLFLTLCEGLGCQYLFAYACVGVRTRQYCTKDNIRNKRIWRPYTKNIAMMTKYWQIVAQTVYMPAVGCFYERHVIYGRRSAPSNHILPLPMRTSYSSHSSLCTLCVLQRDVSTFNLSQVHHQIFMPVLPGDARYTFY